MRLNGWKRIGIVLSVLWFFVGGFWGNEIGLHQGDWTQLEDQVCSEQPHADVAACTLHSSKDFQEAIRYHWDYAAILGLVPIPIGWLIVYGIMVVVRWIRRGFRPGASSA